MIIGIGTDIADVERIRRLYEKAGDTFAEHMLTEAERKLLAERTGKAEFLAGRWAATEALSKALGCGISGEYLFSEVEILPDGKGAPKVADLRGTAKETAERLGVKRIH